MYIIIFDSTNSHDKNSIIVICFSKLLKHSKLSSQKRSCEIMCTSTTRE